MKLGGVRRLVGIVAASVLLAAIAGGISHATTASAQTPFFPFYNNGYGSYPYSYGMYPYGYSYPYSAYNYSYGMNPYSYSFNYPYNNYTNSYSYSNPYVSTSYTSPYQTAYSSYYPNNTMYGTATMYSSTANGIYATGSGPTYSVSGSYCTLAGGGQVWVPSGVSPSDYGC